jgi:hypothetical protein
MDESQRETLALLIRRKCCGNWRLSATLCQAASVKKITLGQEMVGCLRDGVAH